MKRLIALSGAALGVAVGLIACDTPECIGGPSNLTPDNVQECAAPSKGSSVETAITNTGAELLEDGTLVLTLSNMGLECGTRAGDVGMPLDCFIDGWVFTIEIPAELAVPGLIEMSDYPEILGTATVLVGGPGVGSGGLGFGGGGLGHEPFWIGTLELQQVDDHCVTGVLHGFGTGSPDPTMGGPELDGFFVAPRC